MNPEQVPITHSTGSSRGLESLKDVCDLQILCSVVIRNASILLEGMIRPEENELWCKSSGSCLSC